MMKPFYQWLALETHNPYANAPKIGAWRNSQALRFAYILAVWKTSLAWICREDALETYASLFSL